MKASALKYFVISLTASLICIIIVVMPFHGFLTVWGSAMFGHYTAFRLWKEVLLAICALGALYLLMADTKVRTRTLTRRLLWIIAAYGIWLLLTGLWALHNGSVTRKALAYGWLTDGRFLVFFLVTWMVAVRTRQLPAQWQRLLLWPAFGVIAFALLQALVLPHNFLAHFGYNKYTTIAPYFTINDNSMYIRVASTLRGPNPFGAYMIIPISLLLVYVLTPLKRNRSHLAILPFALAALFFSFSRSAWIGAFCAGLFILVVRQGHRLVRAKVVLVAVVALLLIALGAFGLRHNTRFDNVFLHTQDHSASAVSSNAGHANASRAALTDMVHQPFGRGPGTAGPASFYNNKPPRIAENYYLQIGQEAGWIGLILFILINVGVGFLLWTRRADPLALSLLAGLIGLTIVNLLSHAWADDTLTYVWWGLAGIAMAQPAMTAKQIHEAEHGKK